MGEFEDMLNSILSSPRDMEKIMGLARELSGGEEPPEPEPATKPAPDLGPLDPKLLGVMTKLMGELNRPGDDKAALIRSMKPYLRPERQEALDRALKLTKLAHAAKIALTELGGDIDVGL